MTVDGYLVFCRLAPNESAAFTQSAKNQPILKLRLNPSKHLELITFGH